MKAYKNTKAFTLVELIVVITILAILGTIAFTSLSSYTSFARNAIRIDATSKIATKIDNLITGGQSLLSLVNSGSEVPGANIGGTGAIVGVDYQSGIPNYTAMGIKREDFLDPLTGGDYRIGVITKLKGKYEITSSMEDDAGSRASVVGTWSPRTPEAVPGIGNLPGDSFTMTDPTDLGTFFKGDVIVTDGGDTLEVSKVSRDGMTYYFTSALTSPAAEMTLAASEVAGLIVSQDGINPVVDESTTALAYGGTVECVYVNFDDANAIIEGVEDICFL